MSNKTKPAANTFHVNDEFRATYAIALKEVLEDGNFERFIERFVDKLLYNRVKGWCGGDEFEADEVMADIREKVYKEVVTGFLKRPDRNGKINTSADEFNLWIHTLAKNAFYDYCNKKTNDKKKLPTEPIGDNEWNINHGSDDGKSPETVDKALIDDGGIFLPDNVERNREALEKAFRIVMTSDKNVYIPLTWIASSLCVIEQDSTKIRANKFVLSFPNLTLNYMYGILKEYSKKVSWLVITEEMDKNIRENLEKPCKSKENRPYKKIRYGEFFNDSEPLARISDWIYRMNEYIVKNWDKY